MKNCEKYKTVEALEKAFSAFCTAQACAKCPLSNSGSARSCKGIAAFAYMEVPKEKKQADESPIYIASWLAEDVIVVPTINTKQADILSWMHRKLSGNDYAGFFGTQEVEAMDSIVYTIPIGESEVKAYLVRYPAIHLHKYEGLVVVIGCVPLWEGQEEAKKADITRFEDLMEE